MLRTTDIHSLTGFLRDHKTHLKRLSETGRPEVLTVNGEARVVVQSAEAYQRLIEALDAVATERILRERLGSLDRNEPGVPADTVLADVRKALGPRQQD